MSSYRAVVASGEGPAQIQTLTDDDLPEGDVTIDVSYSSLNYKDGLAVTGKGKIARTFPMVCGIDLAGTVVSSETPKFAPGQDVLVTGWGLSETHPGGFAERQRVRSDWVVHRPSHLSLRQTMAVGTAGLTAMLCIEALEAAGLNTDDGGDVIVTGAAGGVGSVAVAVLASLGYRVTASTGRPETHDYLRQLGASEFIDRHELAVESKRPLEKERWTAGIDTVGSTTLASVLRQTRYRGSVAACGLAGGNDLPITVLPFILRGVNLLGIDSVMCPAPLRERAWERLGANLPLTLLDAMTTVEPMSKINQLAEAILEGKTRGRVVIDVRA